MSKPRCWQRGRSSWRTNINFTSWRQLADVLSVTRERNSAARPREFALIRQGIDGLLELGNRSNLGGQTAYLAVAQSLAGRIGDALETVQQALQADPIPFTRWPLIIRGELRLIRGQIELAETDFREIIALTRSRKAKGLELTATISIARLLARQGKREEAHVLLAEIYNWFTEGFDTADLKDAKALLDDLST
jgi:tetratricopeptide (TPR) repeat protein